MASFDSSIPLQMPMSCEVNGMTWFLYTFEFKSPDGEFCSYFYALSDEHAAALLYELKETAVLKGRMIMANI